jgi:hypothetical protein
MSHYPMRLLIHWICRFAVAMPALLLLLTGCAGITHRAIESDAQDAKARGFRYYDSSPYLLVQTDNQGGLTSELVYLPDRTKKRSARPYAYLASNATTLTFQKGVLTDSVSDTDGTAIPTAIIKALESAAASAAKFLAFDKPKTETAPNVYLFKVVKKGNQWGLEGTEAKGPKYQ